MNRSREHITRRIDHLFREEAGKLHAILIRLFGFHNAALAEDVVQETFVAALKRWPLDGMPDNPAAWLMQTTKNKTLNTLKKEKRLIHLPTLQQEGAGEYLERLFLEHEIYDSQLRILTACCHPGLSEKARIILTLKTLSGLSMAEIARALLMKEETVSKSLYRSRKALREENNLLVEPFKEHLADRRDTLLRVLYLMFNEGYKSTEGERDIREDLCFEAMRLVQLLIQELNPAPGRIFALMALFCFQVSRFPARADSRGGVIDLRHQDRTLWDREYIQMGFHYFTLSREGDSVSRYHLEAGIASVHCAAASWEDTDWKTILFYYERLLKIDASPVAHLNRAVALSYHESPEAGLKALERVKDESELDTYYLVHASRADMLCRMGRFDQAASWYRTAMDLTRSEAIREFLSRKIIECDKKNLNKN